MEKSIICLLLVACMVAISHAYPSAEAAVSAEVLGAEQHEAVNAQGDQPQILHRQKRQFGGYGGYGGGGYGGYGGGFGGGYGGGYGGGGYGGYGGYGGGFRRGGFGGFYG